ncbi:acid-sensing ion channel 1B-like [Convolutriloba macropyga]|uniref:acid-sensing ion channel 1B-like n=1 Tax=Convolutriloba macropyga TaxID=536237 RepID=UPI003F52430D
MMLLMSSVLFGVYMSFNELTLFFSDRPTVTEVKMVDNTYLDLPQVMICPVLPNNKAMRSVMPPGSADVMTLIVDMAFNRLFGNIRHDLQMQMPNVSGVFEKYHHLEGHYAKMIQHIDPLILASLSLKSTFEETIVNTYEGLQNIVSGLDNSDTLWDAFLVDFDQMFIICKWKGKDCRTKYVDWKIIQSSWGPCFKFETDDTRAFGPFDALELTVFINGSNGHPALFSDVHFHMFLFAKDEPESIENGKMEFKLQPGMHHDVALEKFSYTDTAQKDPCVQPGSQGFMYASDAYWRSACIVECMSNLAETSCGCLTMGYTLVGEGEQLPTCAFLETILCIPVDARESECNDACLPECSFTSYKLMKKFTKFPNPKQVTTLNSITGRDYEYSTWASSVAQIRIHFASLESQEMLVRFKFNFINLIGSIGGVWGLCMGASVLTTVEIINFLLDFVKAALRSLAVCQASRHQRRVADTALST